MSKSHQGFVAPGDITVTLVHAGYLVGRVLPPAEGAPGWQFIQVVSSKADAVTIAQQLAAESCATAWAHVHDQYHRITP